MTTEQFTYWLQGFFELSGTTTLNEEQVKVIKEHIALVLKKTTPSSANGVWYVQANGPYINPDNPSQAIKENIRLLSKDDMINVQTHLTCWG